MTRLRTRPGAPVIRNASTYPHTAASCVHLEWKVRTDWWSELFPLVDRQPHSALLPHRPESNYRHRWKARGRLYFCCCCCFFFVYPTIFLCTVAVTLVLWHDRTDNVKHVITECSKKLEENIGNTAEDRLAISSWRKTLLLYLSTCFYDLLRY